jgi:hypothetical protein
MPSAHQRDQPPHSSHMFIAKGKRVTPHKTKMDYVLVKGQKTGVPSLFLPPEGYPSNKTIRVFSTYFRKRHSDKLEPCIVNGTVGNSVPMTFLVEKLESPMSTIEPGLIKELQSAARNLL